MGRLRLAGWGFDMARARNIKPSIMDNEELAELEPITRLLFIYLWMLADREGRLEDRPKRIAAQALAYDRTADIDAMLNGLQDSGFITRYKTDGMACIQITAFAKHQTPHIREAVSTLPKQDSAPAKASERHDLGEAEPSPRSPDTGYRIPDSLIPDTRVDAAQAKPAPTNRGSRLPKDFEPDFQFAVDAGIQNTLEESAKFRDYWNSQPGQKGVKLDWPATWRNWCRNYKPRASPGSETPYQRSMREKMEQIAPSIAARNPNAPRVIEINPTTFFENLAKKQLEHHHA